MMDSLNRRDFFRTTGIAGSALALSAQAPKPEGWFGKPCGGRS
ncbi:MAG: twin-arginine translocation signal domain-containing protein [Acidobacteriota bacterium]